MPGMQDNTTLRVYLDNAATTYPKPPEVIRAAGGALSEPPQFHRSGRGGDPIEHCRALVARLFGMSDSRRVILTPSATFGLNAVIHGTLRPQSGHAIATVLEHNSVLRPLLHWQRDCGGIVGFLEPDPNGRVSADTVRACLRRDTRLIAITHASNVTGWVQPVEAIAEIAAARGIPLLIDAAQSAGVLPLRVDALPGRVFVAACGHKALYGPAGTGLLIVPDAELAPLIQGGTDRNSASAYQPADLPLLYESGTPNLPGIAGLAAGVEFVLEKGVSHRGAHRVKLILALRKELAQIEGVRLPELREEDAAVGILSFTAAGLDPGEIGLVLQEVFQIEVRTGLHNAPLIHRALGSAPNGTVRVSVGAFNSGEEIESVAQALRSLLSDDARHRNPAIDKLLGTVSQQETETRKAADGSTHATHDSPGLSEFSPGVRT